ncbi:MAG: LPS-assembly protein LptD, partial [Ignavibacteria bacterium]|nr:LPS-assembly protein LptD [Ignavibacteria bacterium]
SIGGSSTFDMYEYVQNVGRVNKFLISDNKGLLRLTNFGINLSANLSADQFKSEEEIKQKDTASVQGLQKTLFEQVNAERTPDFSIPWNLSVSYSYSIDKMNPSSINKFSHLSMLLSFNLTKQWKFSVSGSYDIFEKKMSAPVIRISRDLHCWNMNFEWYPLGLYRGFRFEIRANASQLQDLKVTKTGGVFAR